MLSKTLHWGHVLTVLVTMVGTNLLSQNDPTKAPREPEPQAQPPVFRAKQILGSKVTIDSDLSIGLVDDIVLDEQGYVEYLLVMNKDQKLVTVPWEAAKFNIEKRIAVVHITQQQFQLVPTYTVQQYPVFTAPGYRTQIYGFYGLKPAQERRAVRRGGVVVQ